MACPTRWLPALAVLLGLYCASFANLRIATPQDAADGDPPPRAAQPMMKGVELYSWAEPRGRDAGQWRFRLMPGTNRAKTVEEILGAGADVIQSVDALKQQLSALAKGEQVFWSDAPHAGPAGPLALPPDGVRNAIAAHCRQLEIELHISGGRAISARDAAAASLLGRWRLRVEPGADPGMAMLAEYHRLIITQSRWIAILGSMGEPQESGWVVVAVDGQSVTVRTTAPQAAGGNSETLKLERAGDTLRTPTHLYERDRTPIARPTEPRDAAKGTWRPLVDDDASDAEKQLAAVARLTITDGRAMRTLSGSISQWSWSVESDDFGVLTVTCRMDGKEPWTEQWVVAGNELSITRGETTTRYINVRESLDPREGLLGVWDFSLTESLHALPGWDGMGEEQRARRRERYQDEIVLEITRHTIRCHACYDYVTHRYDLQQDGEQLLLVRGDGTQPGDRIPVSLSNGGRHLTALIRGLPRVFVRR